jgi:hypothetical protein
VSKDVPRAQTFVAVLNFGLARPKIEREAPSLAKATIFVIRVTTRGIEKSTKNV